MKLEVVNATTSPDDRSSNPSSFKLHQLIVCDLQIEFDSATSESRMVKV